MARIKRAVTPPGYPKYPVYPAKKAKIRAGVKRYRASVKRLRAVVKRYRAAVKRFTLFPSSIFMPLSSNPEASFFSRHR